MRETGAIAPLSEFQIGSVQAILYQAAAMLAQSHGVMLPSDGGRLRFARRQSHGVVGVISPFNVLRFGHGLGRAGAGHRQYRGAQAGPHTAITGGYVIARLFEEAGLPQGCLHVLSGRSDMGQTMEEDRHVATISFTGSSQVARPASANWRAAS